MEEIWKDIPNYEGLYQVSNLGKIKVIERLVRNKTSVRLLKERIKKTHLAKDGYCQVILCKDKKKSLFRVHQLVASAFLGHKICRHEMVINHINHIRSDNRVENIEVVTQRENNSKKSTIGTSKYIGVCWEKRRNKWLSQINIKGKNKFLGHFDNEIDAANAYKKALHEIS